MGRKVIEGGVTMPSKSLAGMIIIIFTFLSLTTNLEAARCSAITQKGTQCKRQAGTGSNYCWQHQKGAVSKKKQVLSPLYQREESSTTPTFKAGPEMVRVLTQGLLNKGFKEHEIEGLLETAGFSGKLSVSQDARRMCLDILAQAKGYSFEHKDFSGLQTARKPKEGVRDYPYNLSPTLVDKDGDGKNSINDWRQMNLEEKRKQVIHNLIRANKDVTRKSVDMMINNLNNLAALHQLWVEE